MSLHLKSSKVPETLIKLISRLFQKRSLQSVCVTLHFFPPRVFWKYCMKQSHLAANTTFWITSWMLIVNIVSMKKQPAEKGLGHHLFLSPHQTTCLWISSGTHITFKQCTLLSCQHLTTCEYRAHNLCFDFLLTSWFQRHLLEPFQNKTKALRK